MEGRSECKCGETEAVSGAQLRDDGGLERGACGGSGKSGQS